MSLSVVVVVSTRMGRTRRPPSSTIERALGRRAGRGLHQQRATTRTRSSSTVTVVDAESTLAALRAVVGESDVLDGTRETPQTTGFLRGARLGRGSALAIARPTELAQIPRLLRAAVDGNCAVVAQGANTGLTGGSVPRDDDEGGGRPTVVVSTRRLRTIWPVDDGERVLCAAGVGLASLRSFVTTHVPGRQSHSTLGSTFLDPTTAAGVAFGSGGTQIRKGPSTTERALYLRVDESDDDGRPVVKLVNTLGIVGLDAVEGEVEYDFDEEKSTNVLRILDDSVDHATTTKFKSNSTYGTHPSHETNYKNELCTFDDGLTRYNADTKGLDCNRSEGKVLILATVHDTFPEPSAARSYWLSFADVEMTARFKMDVALVGPSTLPESLEYMDRTCFEIVDRAGRLMGHFVRRFGSDGPYVAKAWDWKLRIEAVPGLSDLPDKIQYHLNNWLPPLLPRAVMDMGRDPRRHHHVLVTVGDHDDDDAARNNVASFEKRLTTFLETHGEEKVDVHVLADESELAAVTAFRFVAAAAFPTYCAANDLSPVSVDYALPRNHDNTPPEPPPDAPRPVARVRYSHLACNVVHEDLAYERGVDVTAAKMGLKRVVDEVCGGRLPSEHGHGTEYEAPEQTRERWKRMDPLNVMNPGVGGTSTKYRYD